MYMYSSGLVLNPVCGSLQCCVQLLELVLQRFAVALPGGLCDGQLGFQLCDNSVRSAQVRNLRFCILIERVNRV